MKNKCKTCGLSELSHPLKNLINVNTGKKWSCKKFTPEDDKQTDKLYNTEYTSKGCGKSVSGKYKDGGYWEMPCGELGRRCSECQSKSIQSPQRRVFTNSHVLNRVGMVEKTGDTFCLKDERVYAAAEGDDIETSDFFFPEDKVKEFIKILKEDSAKGFCSHTELCEKIDKFTGDLE